MLCLCFSPPGLELGSGKILFDVGADCLLMSDAGDRSRVSSMGLYSFFFPIRDEVKKKNCRFKDIVPIGFPPPPPLAQLGLI